MTKQKASSKSAVTQPEKGHPAQFRFVAIWKPVVSERLIYDPASDLFYLEIANADSEGRYTNEQTLSANEALDWWADKQRKASYVEGDGGCGHLSHFAGFREVLIRKASTALAGKGGAR